MPGVFLVHDGRVVEAFRHRDVAEKPDYRAIASTLRQTTRGRRRSRFGLRHMPKPSKTSVVPLTEGRAELTARTSSRRSRSWRWAPPTRASPSPISGRTDNPIIYANQGFARLTGYEVDEALGRNCRFLQGPDTDPAARRAPPRRRPATARPARSTSSTTARTARPSGTTWPSLRSAGRTASSPTSSASSRTSRRARRPRRSWPAPTSECRRASRPPPRSSARCFPRACRTSRGSTSPGRSTLRRAGRRQPQRLPDR